ncbi:MAG: single-stranded DNA-binding protein [Bacilli bacterium]
MINRVVLVGRISHDLELKRTNSDVAVVSFRVAVDNRQKNADGTRSTSFIPCKAFSQTAENMFKYIRKGSLVGVEGRLNQRSYAREDGTNASIMEVICDSVQFLEPKGAASSTDTSTGFVSQVAKEQNENANLDSLDLPDDDLPFNV